MSNHNNAKVGGARKEKSLTAGGVYESAQRAGKKGGACDIFRSLLLFWFVFMLVVMSSCVVMWPTIYILNLLWFFVVTCVISVCTRPFSAQIQSGLET